MPALLTKLARLQLRGALALAGLGFGLAGCTYHLSEGPVTSFLARDHEINNLTRAARRQAAREALAARPPASKDLVDRPPIEPPIAPSKKPPEDPPAGAEGEAPEDDADSGEGAAAEAPGKKPRDPDRPYRLRIIPLPVVATSPNSGLTVGVLPVILFDEGERLSTIMAPRILYNEISGVQGVFEMRRYFTRERVGLLRIGASTEGMQDHKVEFRDRFDEGRKRYKITSIYEADLTRRFWGLGADSDEDDESSFVFREASLAGTLGLGLPHNLEITLSQKIARMWVGPGRIDRLPSSGLSFPNVRGINEPSYLVSSRVGFNYDSRDSKSIPTEGMLLSTGADVGRSFAGDSVSYIKLDAAATLLLPSFEKRLVTVGRIGVSIIEGKDRDIPFYLQPSVGGKQTNRGYGQGRFVGDGAYVANIEQRFNVVELDILETITVLQLAAFLDAGRVWDRDEGPKLNKTKTAVGVAVRMIVPGSSLVTSIDLGFADEGAATFVGLDYPF